MMLVNRPGLLLVAALALFGLGVLLGTAFGKTDSLAAGTPDSSAEDLASSQAASPVAATPASARRLLDAALSDSTTSDIVDTALTESTAGTDRVNIFVEVNTFVGFGTLSTGEHGIHVQEPAACETGEAGP